MGDDLWTRTCAQLALELPEQQFNTWIRALPPAEVSDDGEAVVVSRRVPNRFKLDWIRSQYAAQIERLVADLSGRTGRLQRHPPRQSQRDCRDTQ